MQFFKIDHGASPQLGDEYLLDSEKGDVLVTELIEYLETILSQTPLECRDKVKCGVGSYWTDVGGYFYVYLDKRSTKESTEPLSD